MARTHSTAPDITTLKSAKDATSGPLHALQALIDQAHRHSPDHPQRRAHVEALRTLAAGTAGRPTTKGTRSESSVSGKEDPIGALMALARVVKSQNPERIQTAVRILAQAHRDQPGGARGAFRVIAKSARRAQPKPAPRQGLRFEDVAQVINKAVNDALAKHDSHGGPVA